MGDSAPPLQVPGNNQATVTIYESALSRKHTALHAFLWLWKRAARVCRDQSRENGWLGSDFQVADRTWMRMLNIGTRGTV